MNRRTTYYEPRLDRDSPAYAAERKSGDPLMNMAPTPHTGDGANLVGSFTEGTLGQRGSLHLPVLDIDYPAQLVPSATPGHFHLYLNREVTWDAYIVLLDALAYCGLIEVGYAEASIRQGQTFVRKPGVPK